MGNSYKNQDLDDKAIECYQKAVEIKPDDHDAIHSIGWSYLLSLNFEQAKIYFLQVWELSSSEYSHAAMNLGHVSLLQHKETDKAISWYKKSIPLWDDANDFYKDMESDFTDLKMEEQEISKEMYDNIIAELKNEAL
jgi:tetratricopeptide (TPR) repeat protein